MNRTADVSKFAAPAESDLGEFSELMAVLSRPRPNGSKAMRNTLIDLTRWLSKRQIPFRLHEFILYPYFFECIGTWLILSRLLLVLAFWQRWGWYTLLIAVTSLVGGTLDYLLGWPLVTWPGAVRGHNLLIEFSSPTGQNEVVLSAHYDTKTELLDHRQRMFLLRSLPFGLLATLIVGLLGPVDVFLSGTGSTWSDFIFVSGLSLAILLFALATALGANMISGRWLEPSPGAVDNGAACAILLKFAEKLHAQPSRIRSHTTIALFAGEEITMQGSRAYVKSRQWPLPACALNLEVLGQDGKYVFWEEDGTALNLRPTSSNLNELISASVHAVSGSSACPAGPINSDGASFLSVGIPATTLGTYHSRFVDTGFHRPTDNLNRLSLARLRESVQILDDFLNRVSDRPCKNQ